MSLRVDFIETPLFNVLQEGIAAANCNTGHGIESHPSLEYILQSIFLRMTGFSEQKLRSIHWYIVNEDLELRYKTLKGGTDSPKFGEYSNLKDKQGFYTWVRNKVKESTSVEINITDATRTNILTRVKSQFDSLFSDSIFNEAFFGDIKIAKDILHSINKNHFGTGTALLNDPLTKIYPHLYKQRNKSAHNSNSYQRDIERFADFVDPFRSKSNYYTYYAILLLVDEVFVELYYQTKEAYNRNF